MAPLYHLLDPLWARAPLPYSSTLAATPVLGLTRIRIARSYLGRELLPVHAWAVGDTLVDTGLADANLTPIGPTASRPLWAAIRSPPASAPSASSAQTSLSPPVAIHSGVATAASIFAPRAGRTGVRW